MLIVATTNKPLNGESSTDTYTLMISHENSDTLSVEPKRTTLSEEHVGKTTTEEASSCIHTGDELTAKTYQQSPADASFLPRLSRRSTNDNCEKWNREYREFLQSIIEMVQKAIRCTVCECTFNNSVLCSNCTIQLNRPDQCACGVWYAHCVTWKTEVVLSIETQYCQRYS